MKKSDFVNSEKDIENKILEADFEFPERPDPTKGPAWKKQQKALKKAAEKFFAADDDLMTDLYSANRNPDVDAKLAAMDLKKKDKKGKGKGKDKKAKAGSSRAATRSTAPVLTGYDKPDAETPKAKAGSSRTPMVLDPSDRISGDAPKPKAKAGSSRSMFLDPSDRISGDAPKPNTVGLQRNPMHLDPSDRISGSDAPKGAAPVRNPTFLDPSERIGGAPSGSTPKAAIDSSKLTGKRSSKAVASFANKLNAIPKIGGWLGPLLVAGEGAKFVADWYAYNTGAARVTQLGDYTAPCLDSSYDPYDDPFVDIYSDDKGTTYSLDYYGRGFKDILNSHNVQAFTPRLSSYVYGIFPTLLTAAATAAVMFQTVGRAIALVSASTVVAAIFGAAAAVISIGVGWIVSRYINKLLASVDEWGPGAADFVAQFTMEQLTTSSSLKALCGTDVTEAAQGDEYQDREEESDTRSSIDTGAIMDSAAAIRNVFKEIDNELQDEGDQEKLAEWRRILKQAKEMAKDQIKG